ncbi:MAG: cbb3-type cytochrome c oxidase N-terminal domain-containing protein [Verrucomicrobiota bacterium]
MSSPSSDPTNDPAYLTEEQKKAGIVLRDHVYDGIREYDQRLPNWWLFTLYIFVVWFVVFWFAYYQLGMFKTDEEEMDIAIAAIQYKKDKQLNALLADLDEEAIWEMSRDPAAVSAGQTHFNQFCSVCHATDLSATLNGTPLPGVPLDDSQWKYCRKPTDVFNIITKGSPDVTKGMVAWDAILGPKKIAETTAFILSHHEPDSPWEPAPDSPENLEAATPPPPGPTP